MQKNCSKNTYLKLMIKYLQIEINLINYKHFQSSQ